MDNYCVQKTDSTIGVILDHEKHYLQFEGDSRPENVRDFFNPIMLWLSEYKNYVYFLSNEGTKNVNIVVDFKFEYFNSSSAKYIIDIIKALNNIKTTNLNVHLTLNWHFEKEDFDILESGQEFIKITEIPMNMVSY